MLRPIRLQFSWSFHFNCTALYTGLFEMTVGVLTTCHTQYTSDSSICIFYLIELHSMFLFRTLQVLCMSTTRTTNSYNEH